MLGGDLPLGHELDRTVLGCGVGGHRLGQRVGISVEVGVAQRSLELGQVGPPAPPPVPLPDLDEVAVRSPGAPGLAGRRSPSRDAPVPVATGSVEGRGGRSTDSSTPGW